MGKRDDSLPRASAPAGRWASAFSFLCLRITTTTKSVIVEGPRAQAWGVGRGRAPWGGMQHLFTCHMACLDQKSPVMCTTLVFVTTYSGGAWWAAVHGVARVGHD